MRGSFVAGCSALPRPQRSQLSCYTDFNRLAGCLEPLLVTNSTCRQSIAEISVPLARCRQSESMAPSRTRSTRVPSLWAATFETTCSLKSQQRLPIEVKAARVLIGLDAADIHYPQVGGIYSVIKSKAPVTTAEYGDRYTLIGPLNRASVSCPHIHYTGARLTSFFRPLSKSNHSFPRTKSSRKQWQAWSREVLALYMAGG